MPDALLRPPVPWWQTPVAQRGFQFLLMLLATVIAALAFSPAPPPSIDTGWDKSNHLLAFAILAVTSQLAFWARPRRTLLTVLGLLIYGAFIELVQSQIPQRSGEWADLLADALGIAVGLALAHCLPARR